MITLYGQVQRSIPFFVFLVDFRRYFEKYINYVWITGLRGYMESCITIIVRNTMVNLHIKKQVTAFSMSFLGGNMKRCLSIIRLSVNIATTLEKDLQDHILSMEGSLQ